MNIRSANSYFTAANTQLYAQQKGETNCIGGVFIGGAGTSVVANKTNGFLCNGGEGNLYLTNQGDSCYIKLGTGKNLQSLDVNGYKTYAYNVLLSAGNGNTINGSGNSDIIFSYGNSCNVNLNGGKDWAFVNGSGTTVNGSADSEYISGVPQGLPTSDYLKTLSPLKFLDMIKNAGTKIVYKYINK